MSVRDNPGPSDYAAGELVEVKLRRPEGEPTYYAARVVRSSRTYLHVRVLGSGNELALTIWDTRCLVRRPIDGDSDSG